MTVLLIIFGILLVAAVSVVIFTKKETPAPTVVPANCCGAHAVCERDRLLSSTDKIVYFDDEELDTLAYRNPESYTDKEYQAVEDVLLSLRESDVVGWLHSLQLRNIALPASVRDEALLIVRERHESQHPKIMSRNDR